MNNSQKSKYKLPREYSRYLIVPLLLLIVSGLVLVSVDLLSDRSIRSLETKNAALIAADKSRAVSANSLNSEKATSGKIKSSKEQLTVKEQDKSPGKTKKEQKPKEVKPQASAKDAANFRGDPAWPTAEEIYKTFQKARKAKKDPDIRVASLRVFLDEQIVAAFTLNDKGEEELIRAFPCSSGYKGSETPKGNFRLGFQSEESWLFDNSLAQYGSQINGNILFHSLPSYDGSLNRGLKLTDLNSMGYAASHGCVRLFYMDAKWICDYCPSGTPVEVLQNRGKQYKDLPERIFYLRLKPGAPTWDPSDADPDNPYHDFALLKKWIVEEPWQQKYKVTPPVWPSWVGNEATESPVESVEKPQESKTEESKSAETVIHTGPYAPTAAPTDASPGETTPRYAPTVTPAEP